MLVNYGGWNEKYGFFSFDIFVDETKRNYEIQYRDGTTRLQNSPFHTVTQDWNNDGDVYPLFGAYFAEFDSTGHFKGAVFWTPEEMVHAVIDALDGEGGVAAIPGIDISVVEQKRNLANKILSANARLSDQTPAQARIKRDYEL